MWVLSWVALYVQQQNLCRPPIAGVEDLIFSGLLVLECSRAGIETWPQMRAMLTEFSYCDTLMPHGSLWFEETLRNGRESSPDWSDDVV